MSNWSHDFPIGDVRERIIAEIARIRWELAFRSCDVPTSRCQQLTGNPVSATEWYITNIDSRIARALDGSLPTSKRDVHASFVRRARVLAGRYVVQDAENWPYVLEHGDMNRTNVLVDDDWKITG